MIRFLPKNIQWVSIAQILDNNLTLFTQSYDSSALIQSIKELGIANPLILKALDEEKFQIVCGHRRTHAAKELRLETIPAWFISENSSEAELIRLNLVENNRTYSDIECGGIISKLVDCGTPESSIIKEYMPLIGLEKSKNLFDQYLHTAKFDKDLQETFDELNIPIRVYSACFFWQPDCQKAIREILVKIKPGVNKVRFLLETIDEIAHRENITPKDVLSGEQISKFLESGETAGIIFDKTQQYLFQRRFPELGRLKRDVILARDKLKLRDQIKIKTSDSFENNEVRLEIKFSTLEEIIDYSNNLAEVAKSEEMKGLIGLFKLIDRA
jgi:ParB/RepB/Spo0J family partition protein